MGRVHGGVVGGHPGVVGSNIGWNPEVLRGRVSGAERVESTNEEYTNGTEAKESQQLADLKASVMSMQADFNLQLTALRKELEEEKMARTRLEQEVRSLKKLASKWQSVRPACGIIKKNLSMKEKHS